MIRIDCPGCGRACEFADYLAGLTVICKNCSQRIPVPRLAQKSPDDVAITAVAAPVSMPAPILPAPLHDDAIQADCPAWSPTTVNDPFPATEKQSRDHADNASCPDWAADYVRVCLQVGMSVPDIQLRLVTRGMSAATAAAVVDQVLESRGRERLQEHDAGEWGELLHRVLSAVLGIICLWLAYRFGSGLSAGRTLIGVLGPVACIWFPEAMGGRHGEVAVRWFGWLALVAILGYRVALLLMV